MGFESFTVVFISWLTTHSTHKVGLTDSVNNLLATITNKHTLRVEDDIEKYIKAEAFLEQFRIKDFFEDFDKLRKGYVTEDKVQLFRNLVPFRTCFAENPFD